MTRRVPKTTLLALLALLLASPAPAGVTASFRYRLSNFSGPVPSLWAQLDVDRERDEVYALNVRGNDIRIFDENGMEIFVFGEAYAMAADIAIGDDGDIFILSTGYQTATVHLLDYRGEHVAEIPLKNVPEEYSLFVADRLVYRNRSLYLVDSDLLTVIVVDTNGYFKTGYDLKPALTEYLPDDEGSVRELEATDRDRQRIQDVAFSGFTVDRNENMLFTVSVFFSAFRLSPSGELRSFGRAGSGKGKFGIAAGIATDDRGYIYVSDRLRCVVLIFTDDLGFVSEFGYRGAQPSNLIVPDDLAIDSRGNVYIGQAANRGVSVFSVVHENVSVSPPYRGETMSTGSEESGRAIEEDESDRLDFVVDRGGEDAPGDSEESGWTIEESESTQLEVIGDEE